MISFLNFLNGYYKIYICGLCPERFLNLCTRKGLLLWKLTRRKEGYQFYVNRKSYDNLLSIQEKTHTTIEIQGKYGLPFFLYRYRKRKLFFAGMIGCGLFIYYLSLFIWDIQIEGTLRYTEEEIEKYLMEKDIHTGIKKTKIHCAGLEEEIREDFPDAAWVSCDIEGTRFRVHLKESIDEANKETKKSDSEPKDIVASKSGQITSIITRNGTPLVKKGDKVKQGDTLISGVIYIYNEFDELLETSKVLADGDIRAKTVLNYEDSFPLIYYAKSYTGRKKVHYQFYLGDYKLALPGKNIPYESYDKLDEKHQLKLGHNIYLPFSFEKTTIREYLAVKKNYGKEGAKEKANKKLNRYLKEQKENGIEIVSSHVQISFEEGKCVAKGTITVIQSIGRVRKIKDTNEIKKEEKEGKVSS